MGRTRAFDIEEATSTATVLFWRSYDKTSSSDLTGALGIGPASFYFAFESKEALFRKIVERYVTRLSEAFEKAFQTPTTRLGVEALLREYADVVTAAEHTPGCLVVNNSPRVDTDDILRQWLAEHRRSLRQNLESRFWADVADGKLPPSSNPLTMARFIHNARRRHRCRGPIGCKPSRVVRDDRLCPDRLPKVSVDHSLCR